LAESPDLRQRLRCLRRQPPRLHPRLPKSGRSCSSSSNAASSKRPCARTRPSNRSTGRPTATRTWSTMRVFAFDHRMQLEQMEGATPEKIGAFKELCLQGRPAKPPTASPATASCATAALAATRSSSRRHRSLDRPSGRMARLAPPDAGARDWPRFRRPPGMAAWSMWSRSCASITPTTMPKPRPRRKTPSAACSTPAAATGWRCSGNHPLQGRPDRRPDLCADHPALL
jgi:hypothetical protein